MKTVKEWLSTFPDGYRELAFLDANPSVLNDMAENECDAIDVAFDLYTSNIPNHHFWWEMKAYYAVVKSELPNLPK